MIARAADESEIFKFVRPAKGEGHDVVDLDVPSRTAIATTSTIANVQGMANACFNVSGGRRVACRYPDWRGYWRVISRGISSVGISFLLSEVRAL
ncbi:MAG: hypothetical protein AAB250_11620, partial [Bdellovibrionota bacterium]